VLGRGKARALTDAGRPPWGAAVASASRGELPLSLGARLGPYLIVEPLGAGGMGEVYRARDPKLDRDVAVKVLPERFAQDAEARWPALMLRNKAAP
jgi:serine/threonine protein kinase